MTRDELIMLFHDGELDEVEAAEARELLARDPAARALLANLELVSALIAELPSAKPTSADITSQVMAQVLKGAPGNEANTRAVALLAPRARAKRALAAVSVALALAAGVALVTSRQQPGQVVGTQDEAVAAPVGAISAPEFDPPEESVAIERIDFGEDPGAIFLVPGVNERTLVVWTIDDSADKGPEVEL